MQGLSYPKFMVEAMQKQYMFLLGGNIMPGTEKLWGELLFPEEKMVVFSTEGRKTIFSEGNKCSSQSFFDPGIMFSAWRIHFLGVSSSDLPQTSTFWWVLILHNLLADRPAPRGAAGGAGGGPPCKSKKTTFKIFKKRKLLLGGNKLGWTQATKDY